MSSFHFKWKAVSTLRSFRSYRSENKSIKTRAFLGACMQSYAYAELSSDTSAPLVVSCMQGTALFGSTQGKCNHCIHPPASSLNFSASPNQICTCHLAEWEQAQSSANSSSTCLVRNDCPHNILSLSHVHILPSDIYLPTWVIFVLNKYLFIFFSVFAVVDFIFPIKKTSAWFA